MTGALGRMPLYALTRTLLGVAVALALNATVIMLIDFVELSRTVGSRADLSFAQLFGLMLLKSPSVILVLLPFVFLFGTMGAFVTLNRTSELVAMRAAGVSAWRFILPAAGAAFLIGVLTITVLNPIAATLNGRFEERKAELSEGRAAGSAKEIWLRQGTTRNQIVIHAESQDMVHESIRLKGVSIFVQNASSGGFEFARRIEAAEARLEPGFWRLKDVREALPGAGSVRSEELSIPSTLDRRTALERFASADTIPFWVLPSTIEHAEQAGYSVAGYRLRLQQLLATPLLFAAMTVLAAAFSLRLMRLGGLAMLAVAGVGVGFVIFFFNQLCGALGSAEVIPPFVAAWAPPTLALLAGVTLLCYTEDG
ncbi:MAG TPA: LPS export ABC transporter permease LptG [Caulobacteraceae bacterium]|nr:LPS export ABC transporter permease LptG [Caulobacteraceae bacterium]